MEHFDAWRRRAIVGYVILMLGCGYLFLKVESTASTAASTAARLATVVQQQKEQSANQLTNRISNVAVWCGAINEGRNESRRRSLIGPPGTPVYRLRNLDCPRLEYETAHSSTHEPDVVHINLRSSPW